MLQPANKLAWILGSLLCGLLGACGAYADAAGEDAGGGEECSLSFSPGETLRQGRMQEYTITFDSPPPWSQEPDARGYLTRFVFDEDAQDIESLEEYDGLQNITVVLKASFQAQTGERRLHVEARRNRLDQAQQVHRGVGLFYVLPASNTDAGTAGDGDDDRGEDDR